MTIQARLIMMAVVLLALAATGFAAYSYGKTVGHDGRNDEVSALQKEKTEAATGKATCESSVTGYKDTLKSVTDERNTLVTQFKTEQADLMKRLAQLKMPVKPSGNECTDTKAIAARYFNNLREGQK